ncbi:MAG: 16S rRNA (uracil(1498)-N(3))-methyltransferase [Elusimicrobia bacterium]|nr:16S rRNA (uracil(1498)-N(3))-methyltransferase [Elusimicrobiota bacterium]
MPLQYYATPESIRGGFCLLNMDESHHLMDVARSSKGDKVRIFDGQGRAYEAEVAASASDGVSCKIIREIAVPKPAVSVKLYFAPVSRQAVEQMLDQCTQLGAGEFHPIDTERGVSDISKSWERKEERWRALLLAACKQCGRADIPRLFAPEPFSKPLASCGPCLFASTDEQQLPVSEGMKFLRGKHPALDSVSVFIGPEGGFSPEEAALALASGAVSVSLGCYIQRTETACASACAAILQ